MTKPAISPAERKADSSMSPRPVPTSKNAFASGLNESITPAENCDRPLNALPTAVMALARPSTVERSTPPKSALIELLTASIPRVNPEKSACSSAAGMLRATVSSVSCRPANSPSTYWTKPPIPLSVLAESPIAWKIADRASATPLNSSSSGVPMPINRFVRDSFALFAAFSAVANCSSTSLAALPR